LKNLKPTTLKCEEKEKGNECENDLIKCENDDL